MGPPEGNAGGCEGRPGDRLVIGTLLVTAGARSKGEWHYDVGVENLMWGSDFPHHDSTFPRSRAVLEDIFEEIPDEERYLITAGNVRNIYHLPVE